MKKRRLFATVAASALAASMVVAGGGAAYANTVGNFGEDTPSTEMGLTYNGKTLLKTYGVRAGSAGPDFLGISNTNYDFAAGNAEQTDQYNYTDADVYGEHGLGIWGTVVNENPNPFYWNLVSNKLSGTSAANVATSWMRNIPIDGTSATNAYSSWGDSSGAASTVVETDDETIAGLEYSPEIIFGANKAGNWSNFTTDGITDTKMYTVGGRTTASDYANNDATNIWTQIYTMGQLATKADSITTKSTRYGSATDCAVNYERAIRGQMLYISMCLDGIQDSNNDGVDDATGLKKKTVAYLYAIDGDVTSNGTTSGTAYFFTPTASGLVNGTDASDNYAANNSTINMGYMGTLPFVTNTYDSGNAYSGLTMTVEDITKTEPVCTLNANTANALADVDVIIYNTNKSLTSSGTSGGKNNQGVKNTGCFANQSLLDAAKESNGYELQTWLAKCGFTGTLVAGDDWGTSKNQDTDTCDANDATVTNASGESVTIHNNAGQCPVLYCMRNYTADKNARAAWAWAQVYPELYGNDTNATYAFWVKYAYHVKDAYASAVIKEMTRQYSDPALTCSTDTVYNDAESGYAWWDGLTSNSNWYHYVKCTEAACTVQTTHAAVYKGSSRASYYDGLDASKITDDSIGIFKPSSLWTNASHDALGAVSSSNQVTMASCDIDMSNIDVMDACAAATGSGPWLNTTDYTTADAIDGLVVSGGKFAYDADTCTLTLKAATEDDIKLAIENGTAVEGDKPGVIAPQPDKFPSLNNAEFTIDKLVIEEGITSLQGPLCTTQTGSNSNISGRFVGNGYLFAPVKYRTISTYGTGYNCVTVELPKSLEYIRSPLFNSTQWHLTVAGDTEKFELPNLKYVAAGAFWNFTIKSTEDQTMIDLSGTGMTDGSEPAQGGVPGGVIHVPEDCIVSSIAGYSGCTLPIDYNLQGIQSQAVAEAIEEQKAADDKAAAEAACTKAGIDYDESMTAAENIEAADAAVAAAAKQATDDAVAAAQEQAAADKAAAVKAAQDSVTVDQKIFAKVTKKTYKAKNLKKKAASFKIGAMAMTGLTYKVTKKASNKISVSKTGKVTLKKGAKKGTYKITVTAAAKGHYKAATKVITIKVK